MSEERPGASAGKVFQLFEQGKKFTEELLKENEKLRMAVTSLRAEMRDLENQYVKVDVPHMRQKLESLEREVRRLREENAELNSQFVSVEDENREFADRYVHVERQNSDLINLYVASYRLHSTLAYDEVLQIIKEIVINMIGSEAFGVYAVNEVERRLLLLAHEGLDELADQTVRLGEGVLGKAAESGALYTAVHRKDGRGSPDAPLACIPLKVSENTLGVIAIYELLPQKQGFEGIDFELFELLGGHAATAIYASKLYSESERKRTTLEGFLNLLKGDVSHAGDRP